MDNQIYDNLMNAYSRGRIKFQGLRRALKLYNRNIQRTLIERASI